GLGQRDGTHGRTSLPSRRCSAIFRSLVPYARPPGRPLPHALVRATCARMSSPPPIAIERFVKVYKTVPAVDAISFTLAKGSVTGLLGGNGAGKTTTIAAIMGLTTPTSGTVRVLGAAMPRERYQVL